MKKTLARHDRIAATAAFVAVRTACWTVPGRDASCCIRSAAHAGRCRASGLRISPPPTDCPTITSIRCWWMETASGRARRTGLAVYENQAWKIYTTKDGLAHRAVLSLALDKRTGDVWAGTMGGLSRISGGRIDSYTQLNSGLSNDVVYGVSVEGENVWVATAAGGCRLNLRTGQWTLYNERNTPMMEIWVYGVSATPTKVYYAVWGSGRSGI